MSETLVALKDVLRRYPDVANVCVEQLGEINTAGITEPAARAAYVWMLGQFGQVMQVRVWVGRWLRSQSARGGGGEVSMSSRRRHQGVLTDVPLSTFTSPPTHRHAGEVLRREP